MEVDEIAKKLLLGRGCRSCFRHHKGGCKTEAGTCDNWFGLVRVFPKAVPRDEVIECPMTTLK
jgi:hypothetical protein